MTEHDSDPRTGGSPGARCSRAAPWPASAPSWPPAARPASRRAAPTPPRRPRRARATAPAEPGRAADARATSSTSPTGRSTSTRTRAARRVSPTLEQFTAKYGTKVNYSRSINDNDSFFGTIQPPLQAGQDTGWDLIVLTDWMAARLIRLGWVETIDTANMPNFVANLQDVYKGVAWDPDNEPAGALAVRHDRPRLRRGGHRRRSTSLDALWTDDPRWKGKVWFLTEMRDTVGLTLLKLGYEPERLHDASRPTRRSPRSRRRSTPGSSAASSATTTRRTSSRATWSSATAWSGDIIQAQLEKETLAVRHPRRGRDALDRQHADPEGRRSTSTRPS